MAANNHPKAQIVITSTAEPARCSRCQREIATWIVAATPANPRRHLVRVGTAYYTDNEGLPICPDCFPEYEQEQRMKWETGQRRASMKRIARCGDAPWHGLALHAASACAICCLALVNGKRGSTAFRAKRYHKALGKAESAIQ